MSDDDVVHRGVRWQRSTNGAVRWWDDDGGRWVRYGRGADAPPRPPGWDRRRLGGVAKLTIDRPPWRSPYRVVPVVLLAAILVIGLTQALSGSDGQTGAEARAASALKGRCLVQHGVIDGRAQYGAKGVACTAAGAVVQVAEVLPGTPGSPGCPGGSTGVVLAYAGVRYPHQLCVVANTAG